MKKSSIPKKPRIKDGYEVSRVMYWLQSAFAYFISVLSSGAYLAKLTSEVGISDSMTAVLTALTSLAGISQLISIKLASKRRVKGTVTVLLVLAQLLYAGMYMIPFLPISRGGMTVIFFVTILSSKVLTIVPSPLQTTWYMNLVPMQKRGMFTAINQIVSLASGAAVSFGASYIIDKYAAAGDLQAAFLILTVVILVFALCHLFTLVFSKEKPKEETAASTRAPLFASIKSLLGNKLYKRLVIVLLLEALGSAVITPFLGTYQTKELGFSMTFISVITLILSLVGMGSIFLFGRISQEVEYKTLLKLSYPITFLAYIINAFTVPANGAVMYIIYSIVLRFASSATAVSQTNLIFQITSREQQTAALSVFSIASGILSFLVTLAVSPFVDYMQSRGNQLFGMTVYAQQILSLAAALLFLAGALVYFFVFLPAIDGGRKKEKKKRTA